MPAPENFAGVHRPEAGIKASSAGQPLPATGPTQPSLKWKESTLGPLVVGVNPGGGVELHREWARRCGQSGVPQYNMLP